MKLAMSGGVQNTYQMMGLEYSQGIETSLVVFIFVFICKVLFVFLCVQYELVQRLLTLIPLILL